MADNGLMQNFTANVPTFLNQHLLTILGGAPTDTDRSHLNFRTGYVPPVNEPDVLLRPGELVGRNPAPPSTPATMWANELSQQIYKMAGPKRLAFCIDDKSTKFFRDGRPPRTKLYGISFDDPAKANNQGYASCYYLPYRPKDCYSMILDNGADYFFTDAINGCSFQVTGTRDAPEVSHANIQGVFNDRLKRAFLHHMLEPARREAMNRGANITTSRLQRFESSQLATGIANLATTDYGLTANQQMPNQIGGYTKGRSEIQYQGIPYQVVTRFLDPSGNDDVDPSGGEVSVIGVRDTNQNQWTFYWQMYVPLIVRTDYYRLNRVGGRNQIGAKELSVDYKDHYVVDQGTQLWP